jgi:parallel beta-helix repeat protein
VKGLVVNRFSANGVTIQGGGNSRVEGSFIGTDAGGTLDLGNTKDGVLTKDSPNNVIGGSAPGAGNLISGNGQYGVEVVGNASTGNAIRGNFIGTDRMGGVALGNSQDGVNIGSSNNTVGAANPLERNIISGNGLGIQVYTSTGNILRGNFIGTNNTGTARLSNGGSGITVSFSATGNTIGGTDAGARNLISGNDGDGIPLLGSDVPAIRYRETISARTLPATNRWVIRITEWVPDLPIQ